MTELNDKQLEETVGGLDVPGTHNAPTYNVTTHNPVYVTQTEKQEPVTTPVIVVK